MAGSGSQHQGSRAPGHATLLDRARAASAEGRPWKARAHLHTLLQRDPGHGAARDLLIQIQLELGDTLGAGRALLVSERDDAPARAASAAWIAHHRDLTERKSEPWLETMRILDALRLTEPDLDHRDHTGDPAETFQPSDGWAEPRRVDTGAVAALGPVARSRIAELEALVEAPPGGSWVGDAFGSLLALLVILVLAAIFVVLPLLLFVAGAVRLLGWVL